MLIEAAHTEFFAHVKRRKGAPCLDRNGPAKALMTHVMVYDVYDEFREVEYIVKRKRLKTVYVVVTLFIINMDVVMVW